MIDRYFDKESFDKPVKKHLTQNYFYVMDAGYFRNIEIFVQENQIDLLDDYMLVEGSKDGRYYSVADQKDVRSHTTSDLFGIITLSLHPETKIFKRTVFTILDVLSQIGGIFSLLQSLCGVIVGIYAQKMLFYAIFSKCYTFDQNQGKGDLKEKEKQINFTEQNIL